MTAMSPETAIKELEQLTNEAASSAVLQGGEEFTSWKARVRSVMELALGPGHHLVSSFEDVDYYPRAWTSETPDSYWDKVLHRGIREACGLIDAAIYDLRLSLPAEEPVDQRAFDPELWEYVRAPVEAEDWAKVPALVATFVESHVRTWAGDPTDSKGEPLVGKGLFMNVLQDDSEYRLGRARGEIEGWRALGVGFVQALSNVARHRIQDRDDAHRYAIGVLGLGSLLLTQLRYEHGDHFQVSDAEDD